MVYNEGKLQRLQASIVLNFRSIQAYCSRTQFLSDRRFHFLNSGFDFQISNSVQRNLPKTNKQLQIPRMRFVDLFGTHQVPQFETKVQEVEVGVWRDGWMMVDGWGRGFGGGTKQCLFNVGGGKNQDLISVQSNITSSKSPQHVLCAIEFQVKSVIPWWFENQWPFNTAHHLLPFHRSSIEIYLRTPKAPSGCPWILGATQCGSKLKDHWTKLTYQSMLILTFSSLMCDRSSLQLHAMNLLTFSGEKVCQGRFWMNQSLHRWSWFCSSPDQNTKQMGLPFVIFPSFFHCGATIYHEIFSGQVSLKPVWSPLKHCRFDIVV